MHSIAITIENGQLSLPAGTIIPSDVKRAILLFEDEVHSNDDIDTLEFSLSQLCDNPSLAFLNDEPDLYSIEDIKPENRNPNFIRR